MQICEQQRAMVEKMDLIMLFAYEDRPFCSGS
jgi:hypothetical protein